MKIAFLDLTHSSFGVTTNTVPLAAGLIATYISQNAIRKPEIRIYKSAEKALEELATWGPQVIGLSQYSWNTQLNIHVATLIKDKHPSCIVVAGGPNQAISIERRASNIQRNPVIDLCVMHDGELPMLEIVNRLIKDEELAALKENLPAGCYCLNNDGCYRESVLPAPRLKSLDVFGPVYADGVYDEFLDAGQMPFVQTHRGCPFSCTFCTASDRYMSEMLFQSPEIFRQDMEYLARRFAGRHDITLYIANTNLSLFREDFPIAEIIRDMQQQYDWPRYLSVNSGKDPQKLLEMLSIINFEPAIALQTLTPEVLTNIKRKNIPFVDYVKFQNNVLRRTGVPSASEIIMSLPGETKQSFLETIRKVLNSGVQNLVMLTFMNLQGAPTSSVETARQYAHVFRQRVVPRQYSIINGKKVFDTEEVIIGTKTMPFEDYLELRALYFTITVFFNSVEFFPLRRFLSEQDVDMAEWIFAIHARLHEKEDILQLYNAFVRETREELFDTEDELLAFYEDQNHFKELTEGQRGDNLSRKYKLDTLSDAYTSCLSLGLEEAEKIVGNKVPNLDPRIFSDLQIYLLSRNMKENVKTGVLGTDHTVALAYDIPAWLQSEDASMSLESFAGRRYRVFTDEKQQRSFSNALHTYKEVRLSLQILYRDGMIKDYWPQWQVIPDRPTR